MKKLLVFVALALAASVAVAQTIPISNLPSGGTILNTDLIPIVRGGVTMQGTLPTLGTMAQQNASAVAITGGTIQGATLNSTTGTGNLVFSLAPTITTPKFYNQITSVATVAPPVVSSCGTTPSISATASDVKGTVTTGTGSPTACTVTFNMTYATAPDCVVSSNSTTTSASIGSVSTAALVINFSVGFTSGKVTYHCIQ